MASNLGAKEKPHGFSKTIYMESKRDIVLKSSEESSSSDSALRSSIGDRSCRNIEDV